MGPDILHHVLVDLGVGVLRLGALRCLGGFCEHPQHRWRLRVLNGLAILLAASATVVIVG